MKMNQKIIVAFKNVSKIIASLLLAFIMLVSMPLLSSSDDEREARDEGIFGLIDGGLGFDMMEQRSIDGNCGFVSGEDSEAGVHSGRAELSCASAEQFSRKRKRAEGDERRAKRAPAPDRFTAAHVLPLADSSVDLAPLQPFLLSDQDLDPALLLSLPLPCPDLSPVELQSDDQPLDGLFGTYEYGQDVADVSGAHVAVGAAGDKAVASEGVDVVSGKRKRGNAGGAIKVRGGEKSYACDVQGCKFITKLSSSLKRHNKMHTGEKPFKCDFPGCTHATDRKGSLEVHKRGHTGEKPFECDFPGCTHATDRKGSLEAHKRGHTGEKPFGCDFSGCTYATARKGSLEAHKRGHTGEKPFECVYEGCVYAAGDKGSLKLHIRSKHTGEKPFGCDFSGCTYATDRKGSLEAHKRWHTGEKPFGCDFPGCTYASARKCDIGIHIRSKHTGEQEQSDRLKDLIKVVFSSAQSKEEA